MKKILLLAVVVLTSLFMSSQAQIINPGEKYLTVDGFRYIISNLGVFYDGPENGEAELLYNSIYADKNYGNAILFTFKRGQTNIPYNIEGVIEIPPIIQDDEGKKYVVTEISSAFMDCKKITEVILPNSVQCLSGSAFYGCQSLQRITLPDFLYNFGEWPFYGCSSLEYVKLPKFLSILGNGGYGSFEGCDKLRTIVCPATIPPKCNDNDFTKQCYQNATLYVPSVSIEDYKVAEGWKNFRNISSMEEFEAGVENISMETPEYFIYTTDGLLVYKGENIDNIDLPSGIYITIYKGKSVKMLIK